MGGVCGVSHSTPQPAVGTAPNKAIPAQVLQTAHACDDWRKDFHSFNIDSLIFPNRIPRRIATVPYRELEPQIRDAPKLGAGGFGVVYQLNFRNHEVAVKKVNEDEKNEIVNDFIREIAVLGTISHPNIVALVGISCDATNHCLLYELMELGSLADLIDLSKGAGSAISGGFTKFLDKAYWEPGTHVAEQNTVEGHFIFGWPDRLTTALDACLGLACLHECFLLHCDIKPENILVRGNGRAALADFGLSRSLSSAAQGGAVAFTHGYEDPEWKNTRRKKTRRKYTDRSDVYAMGKVVLQLLSGKTAKSLNSIMKSWERELGNGIPQYVARMCHDANSQFLDGPTEWDLDVAALLAEIGLLCCQTDSSMRPTMRDTLDTFTKICRLESCSGTMCPGLRDIYSRLKDSGSEDGPRGKGSNIPTPQQLMQWGAIQRHRLEKFESMRGKHVMRKRAESMKSIPVANVELLKQTMKKPAQGRARTELEGAAAGALAASLAAVEAGKKGIKNASIEDDRVEATTPVEASPTEAAQVPQVPVEQALEGPRDHTPGKQAPRVHTTEEQAAREQSPGEQQSPEVHAPVVQASGEQTPGELEVESPDERRCRTNRQYIILNTLAQRAEAQREEVKKEVAERAARESSFYNDCTDGSSLTRISEDDSPAIVPDRPLTGFLHTGFSSRLRASAKSQVDLAPFDSRS